MQNNVSASHNYFAFLWHAVFLSITVTFTEVNSVIPAMILEVGGSEFHIGIVTAIMIGVPLVAQLNFAGFLHGKRRKKPYLLAGINVRVLSLALIALTLMSASRLSTLEALLLIYAELLLFTTSGAFAGISYVDLVGKSFPRQLRQRFFTRKQMISSIGILFSAIVARQVLRTFAYPQNYSALFIAAAAVLLVATFGFWMIREEAAGDAPSESDAVGQTGTASGHRSYLKTLKSIPTVLHSDPNLRSYLWFVNGIGFHVALIPFYVALAKQRYFLDPALAGNLLFVQIIGMITASLIWPRIVRRGGFKKVLKYWSMASFLLPPAALLISRFLPLEVYIALFLLTGTVISARKVSQDAVIVELSTEENRVLYTAIIGTLNLSIALFPIVLGTLIGLAGYTPVFLLVSALSLAARFVLRRLVCPIDRPAQPMIDSGLGNT